MLNNSQADNTAKPVLSVIVPIYNVEDFLPDCLNSLLSQGFSEGECEIICINDGSPDNSSEVVKQFQKNSRDIILLEKENGGVSSARNLGIKNANGKYILFCDPDDYINAGYLKRLIVLIEENNCASLNFKYEMVPQEASFSKTDDRAELVYELCRKKKLIANAIVCTTIVERAIYTENSLFFNEGLQHGEDHMFSYGSSRYIDYKKHIYLSNVIYNYRRRANSAVNKSRTADGVMRNLEDLIRLAIIYRDEYAKLKLENCENKLFVKNTKVRMHHATSGVLFLAARMRNKMNIDDLLTRLKREGLYPYPILWHTLKKSHTEGRAIALSKLLFPIEFIYKIMIKLLRRFFPLIG